MGRSDGKSYCKENFRELGSTNKELRISSKMQIAFSMGRKQEEKVILNKMFFFFWRGCLFKEVMEFSRRI